MKITSASDRRRLYCFAVATVILMGGCRVAPKTELTASDIPTVSGTVYEAYQNNPGGDTTSIAFDAKGPWDFSDGPDRVFVKSQIINAYKGAKHELFPGATYAEKIFASDYTDGATAYNFVEKSSASLDALGQSVAPRDGEPLYKRFTKPERLLVFPLRIGNKWTDDLSIDGEAGIKYKVAKEVIARGQVTVPAGVFFDCFMVRITKTSTINDGTKIQTIMYVWWAPGTGLIAAAGSRPGEQKLYFNEASYLFRLKNYTIRK